MGLKLTVLGCSGSYPGPGEACSGYLLEGGNRRVLLEAGPGTVGNLQRHVSLEQIDAVVLSHHHPDHWSDLGVLRTAWKYGLRREGLVVLGTAGTRDIAMHLVGHELEPTIEWAVVGDGDEERIGGLELRFSRTEHYVETLAVRVDFDGGSFAYSADTGPAWRFDALGAGIGTALCEASMLAVEREGASADVLHLSAAEAGEMARSAGIRRLLLTHLPPGSDPDAYRAEAEASFGGPVERVVAHESYHL